MSQDPKHDTDPVEPLNGEDTGRISDRELLARVDERSMAMHQALQQTRSEVRGLRDDYRRDMVLVRERFIALEKAVDDGFAGAKRSAEASGEHLEQELQNLRELVARKDREALEAKLATTQKDLDARNKEIESAAEDFRKRKRDLIWKVLEWAVLGLLGAFAMWAAIRLGVK